MDDNMLKYFIQLKWFPPSTQLGTEENKKFFD